MPKSTRLSTGRGHSVHESIKGHRDDYSVNAVCRLLEVAPSGYYDCLNRSGSKRPVIRDSFA